MSSSDDLPQAEIKKHLFDAVLNGASFKEAGEAFGIGQYQARSIFFDMVRKAGHEVWSKARRETGADIFPPLKWLKANKNLVVAAMNGNVKEVSEEYLTERKVSLGLLKEIQFQRSLVEEARAARAANKAGYDAVIQELREEVARLKGGSQGALLSGVADIAHCGGLASLSDADAITAIRKLTLTHFKKSRRVDQMKRDVLAALRAEGGAK